MTNHKIYINRCIDIAKNGLGSTRPNPMVGCVIVHDSKIIAEGFTSPYGGNHAEVNAINAVKDKSILKHVTLYVTLEPCSHTGKTPPCSDLIIKYNIPNIVIGCIDDNPEVAGKGIRKLKAAGCNVIVGVLEHKCKMHHKRFFTFHNKKRPYIILKWAQTADGYIAPSSKDKQKPVWITNKHSRQLVHQWRTEEHAILVGTTTVIADNPSLTARDWQGQHPIRVVIDQHKKLDEGYSIFDDSSKTIIISNDNADFSKPLAQQVCNILYENTIQSVIIEGGAKTIQTFIDENLWDEARIFKGALNFETGIKAPTLSGQLISEEVIKDDSLSLFVPSLKKQKIKTLIFDFGDVFINLDKSGAWQRALQLFKIDTFTDAMLKTNLDYEQGFISTEEFLRFYESTFPNLSQQEIIDAWNYIIKDFPYHRVAWLKQLKASGNYNLILLSNTNSLHIDFIKTHVPFYEEFKSLFDVFYLSHKIGLRKPNNNIYDFVLEKNKLVAEECLFVDDTKENTDAAKSLGIHVWNIDETSEDVTHLFKINADLF